MILILMTGAQASPHTSSARDILHGELPVPPGEPTRSEAAAQHRPFSSESAGTVDSGLELTADTDNLLDVSHLKLTVLSLRYSSWSMRPWLALTHAGAIFDTETVELPHMQRRPDDANGSTDLTKIAPTPLSERRTLGSVHGLFPVLRVDDVPIHESLAICEYVADTFPNAGLWPEDALNRARARAISCEMVSGFMHMRGELSCHLFARVPDYSPSEAALVDISRIFELWGECLDRSGGPFLFGNFSIADAMYFPVLTRFRTYGVALAESVTEYARTLESSPSVQKLFDTAGSQPRNDLYDDYVRGLGGNPDATLPTRSRIL